MDEIGFEATDDRPQLRPSEGQPGKRRMLNPHRRAGGGERRVCAPDVDHGLLPAGLLGSRQRRLIRSAPPIPSGASIT